MGTGDLGGADDGTQVVGIGDLVCNDDKERLIPGLCVNILHGGVVGSAGDGDHALVVLVAAHAVQLGAAGLLDRDPLFLGHGQDPDDAALGLAAGDQDALHRAAALEQLDHTVAANDDILPLHSPGRFFLLGAGLGPRRAAIRFRTGLLPASRAVVSVIFHNSTLHKTAVFPRIHSPAGRRTFRYTSLS